jgi:hypothetical protein
MACLLGATLEAEVEVPLLTLNLPLECPPDAATPTVLVCGDGDFSYALALARNFSLSGRKAKVGSKDTKLIGSCDHNTSYIPSTYEIPRPGHCDVLPRWF